MQDDTVEILRSLVGFDITSQRSNRTLIDWVAAYLGQQGVEYEIQTGHESSKFNLFATIGPKDVPGLMLSAHSDVAPVWHDGWSTDPFRLVSHDERLYGRGVVDAKGWLASCLATVPYFKSLDLKKPLHIAITYNGEGDMKGMARLVEHFDSLPARPAAAVVGGPTMMRVVAADKGSAIWRVRVKGKEMHSSRRHRGVSAVETAAQIINYVVELQRRQKQGARNEAFEFPYSSLHVGSIKGGSAVNILAGVAKFPIEIRTLPNVDAKVIFRDIQRFCEGLLPEMRAIDPDCAIDFVQERDVHGLSSSSNRELTQMVGTLLDDGRPYHSGFGSEAGVLQDAGIQTVVCGPGEIKASHLSDEFVELKQLDRCRAFLRRLGMHLSSDEPLLGKPSPDVTAMFR